MCRVMTVTTENGTNGIELYFDRKPAADVLEAVKGAAFRWHRVKKCWYHKDTPAARAIAAQLGDGEPIQANGAEQPATIKPASKKAARLAPLFERCDVASIPAHPENLANKEIAAQVRAHLRERFPEVKFSLRCRAAGYTGAIDGEIIASPYGRERIMKDRYTGEPDRWGYMQNSPELEAVLKYFDAYLQSYNYDNSDYMTDYFDVGFYGRFEIASSYTQTDPTPEQAEQIAEFVEMKKADDERKEAEQEAAFEREERERAERAKLDEIRREQEARDIAAITEHVTVADLAEPEQIAVCGLMEGIGKENSLREVRECVAEKEAEAARKGKDPASLRRDAVICRKVIFTDVKLFERFGELFLSEWGFLTGKGGSASEDVRVNSWEDFLKLNAEQRETVHTFAADCVGVYLGNVLQYVIDPQGYEYARYVMIPTDGTTEQNAQEYRAKWRAKSEECAPFYMPKTIAEQLEAADLREGEQITALVMNGWICTVQNLGGKLLAATPCEFAQYKDAARIEYIPTGKRTAHHFFIHNGQDAVIYRGTLPEVPDNIKYTPTHSPNMYELNFSGMNADKFIRRAIAYYEQLGYKPVLDTVQR